MVSRKLIDFTEHLGSEFYGRDVRNPAVGARILFDIDSVYGKNCKIAFSILINVFRDSEHLMRVLQGAKRTFGGSENIIGADPWEKRAALNRVVKKKAASIKIESLHDDLEGERKSLRKLREKMSELREEGEEMPMCKET